jgi:hypothetical protein
MYWFNSPCLIKAGILQSQKPIKTLPLNFIVVQLSAPVYEPCKYLFRWNSPEIQSLKLLGTCLVYIHLRIQERQITLTNYFIVVQQNVLFKKALRLILLFKNIYWPMLSIAEFSYKISEFKGLQRKFMNKTTEALTENAVN